MLCKTCQQTKTPADFYSGVASRCKDCHKAAMKHIRLTNPRVQEYDRARYHEPDRKKKTRLIAEKWRRDNPEAYRAQTAVNNAVRDGRLKKTPCVMCGSEKNIHGHHKDYTRPLDVVWLCATCHHRVHATFPELGGHFEKSA